MTTFELRIEQVVVTVLITLPSMYAESVNDWLVLNWRLYVIAVAPEMIFHLQLNLYSYFVSYVWIWICMVHYLLLYVKGMPAYLHMVAVDAQPISLGIRNDFKLLITLFSICDSFFAKPYWQLDDISCLD